jgi:methylmalonyl-CoA/ethylmalonyl-CoA epimerase
MTLPIDHVAIVVRSLDEALTFYRDALGLEVTERREVAEEGVEVAFLPLARGRIELVRPLTDEGGVARFLEKRGEGLHHICLVVDNIAETIEHLREAGADLVTDEPQVGADGTRYIFIHPKSAHGVLLELYEESP